MWDAGKQAYCSVERQYRSTETLGTFVNVYCAYDAITAPNHRKSTLNLTRPHHSSIPVGYPGMAHTNFATRM